MRAILLVPLVTVPALSCIAKEPDFFPTANTIVDVDGPVFQAFSPAASLTGPFNINSFGFQVVDLPGSNGAPPSGVDLNSVEVLVGPTRKTATRTGDNYTVDLAGIADGVVVMTLGAKDLYGNAGSGVVNFRLKRTGPRVEFTNTVQADWQSNRSMETFTYTGTVMDPYLGMAVGAVYRAGSDGQCRVDNALLWPVGNGTPSTVSQNTFNYGLSGSFQVSFNAWNGVAAGGLPITGRYCLGITAQGRETDALGAPNPTTTTVFHSSSLEWRAVPRVIGVSVTPDNISLNHPATQQMTATVTGDPGVSSSVTWSATPSTVASINQSGLVTTVGAGQVDVSACSTVAPTICGTSRLSVVQAPADFTVSFSQVSWNHTAFGGGLSHTCVRGQVSYLPGMQADVAGVAVGTPVTITWSGGVTNGTTTRTVMLDANKQFFDRQGISAFATYTVTASVTSDGITRTATGTTTVNNGTGTCPVP